MEGEAETVSSSPVSLLNSLVNSALNYSSKQHYHFPGALGPSGQGTLDSQVQSLGWQEPLEEEMATHSSMLAWRISWMEDPGGLQSMGSQRVGHD